MFSVSENRSPCYKSCSVSSHRYTLELTDLQVMSGRMKDNWKHIHHRTTTSLHVVDRLSISVQLERYRNEEFHYNNIIIAVYYKVLPLKNLLL